jgi:hypothetical protein
LLSSADWAGSYLYLWQWKLKHELLHL